MNRTEQSIIQGMNQGLLQRVLLKLRRIWQDFLVSVHIQHNRHIYRWAWRSNSIVFDDSEPYIRLYWELSKGGCKDFDEEICYTQQHGMVDEDGFCVADKYSKLTFKQYHQPGYAHFFPLVLGTINEHRNENICPTGPPDTIRSSWNM